MARRQVTCINKRGGHYSPHERIQAIGGTGWKHREEDAIRWIETGAESYFLTVNYRNVNVVVAVHQGRRYLKTDADGYEPNNLLALPECP